ncbi:MAG: DUF3131 domain-containing protein [Sphingomonas sp.]|nr:DUF3131 domain-containing protein [Sphingomonas sp.]
MSDAIVRTIARLTFTRRNLLQWVTAADLASGPEPRIGDFYRRMAGAVVIGIIGLGLAWYAHSGTLPLALSFGLLWIASPGIAAFISATPEPPPRLFIASEDAQSLRCIARRTWRYFETFVTPEDNMLPPDNFQEDPHPVVARRTSPTNIGMYLLSIVSARDLGWIGTIEAVERIEATIATLSRLARFRGHFYNWYDTGDLRVLDPPYVSSVDSGNLAGHLIVVSAACREWTQAEADGSARLAGSTDSLLLAREAVTTLHSRTGATSGALRSVDAALDEFAKRLQAAIVSGQIDDAELTQLAATAEKIVQDASGISVEAGDEATAELYFWAEAAQATISSHRRDFAIDLNFDALALRLGSLADATRELASEMEFAFLLDDDRKLLSIGYLGSEGKLDANCYDLLASEARLASFLAIAKGEVPARHWFQLGHSVTPAGGGPALISWSGSMFEYLMPTLIMRAPADSLLERTERRIVKRQIEYGRQQNIPWGISESAFNARDLEFTYQYSNFGVPGLGLKRGLGENKVIAPYATALAAMVEPQEALRNFTRLADAGGRGRYGFYEALDYTASRVPAGKSVSVVHSFMAHHQGMTIVALTNTLLSGIMRDRFHQDPLAKAAELLLQERMPRQIAVTFPLVEEEGKIAGRVKEIEPPAGRRYANAHSASPATHMLSNGRYSVMLTTAGSGQTRWRDLAVTRWRADTTCDDWGSYVFLRDINSGEVWSAGYQPTVKEPETYTVVFNEDRAEYSRRDGDLTTGMTVLVSAEDDSEVRRIAISNSGRNKREVEVTSYVELAMAPQSADVAHPAFSRLFVETERLAGSGALLAGRRRRSPDEHEIWAAHLVTVEENMIGNLEFETDRARFVGRGSAGRVPRTILEGRSLTGSKGTVLDPIFALRARVQVAPGATVHLNYWTMVGSSRESVLDLVDKNQAATAYERAAALAWTQAHVQLHHLRLSPGDAGQFQRLAGHLLYASPSLRPPAEAIAEGAGPQTDLWSLGLSGDLPIIVLRVADIEHLGIVRELVQAADYWRMKRLVFDVVILNERGSSYIQELQDAIEAIVRVSQGRSHFGERPNGGIFVIRSDLVPERTRALLLSVARAILAGQNGRLSDQLDSRRRTSTPKPRPRPRPASLSVPVLARPPGLEYFNGLGGFSNDGREYVIILGPGQNTPAPWINVIANPNFGFQVSEEGAGYAWAQNSREHQLTPWFNDPVRNPPGQTFSVRDDETGDLWSPTASPMRDEDGVYVARHGLGYSQFEHDASGLSLSLLEYVPISDPLKISRLTIRNMSGRPRQLSVTAYAEWVLGPSRRVSAIHTTTAIDARTKAMFARNKWNGDFGDRVAFLDLGGRQTSWTGNRTEFIGRNGGIDNPAALSGPGPLSNWVGAGVDPCGALLTSFHLAPGASIELVTLLGEGEGAEEAGVLIERYRAADLDGVLNEVKSFWDDLVGGIQVKTPDRSLDIMVNSWLLYQTLVCRVWARSGLYQASGAYGFRDQLQDGMALAAASPSIVREHLIRAAGRQFVEGDVQHWWLPHNGVGVRTRISDDRIWLAFATAHYVATTGDLAVLEEQIAFLDGPILDFEEHEKFFIPEESGLSANLYEHCARALDASLAVGNHGVPLFGGGDWNDGFNSVGEGGKGESVWLGWFLHTALTKFLQIAKARNDKPRVTAWKAHIEAVRIALDEQAWDGDWYKRGWFDDGTPLGSSASEECRIDSIAQSWAVISGAGDSEHVVRAMAAVERELINRETGLAILFAPPFDRTAVEPGYIKGYPPGVRENGGQYTHASLWSVIAFAMLGEGDKAASLLAMLNPINHSRTRSEAHRYKLEPYVVAADIYSNAPHVGRGGWSWYTGAAGWMYRAAVEHVLGLRIEGDYFHLAPCIPRRWRSYEIFVKHGTSRYEFTIENPDSVCTEVSFVEYDGVVVDERPIRLAMRDDGQTHRIRVTLGAEPGVRVRLRPRSP